MTNSLRRGYVDSPFGQLHYVEQGAGPVVLLLHQTPRSWDEFREVIPFLAEDHRVIAMDMLGFGASAREGATQSIEGMAKGALALLDALGLESATVVGHHTGGAVAVEVAASAPEQVEALVLSSAPFTDASFRAKHSSGQVVDEVTVAEDGSHLQALWQMRMPDYPVPVAGLLNRFIRDALAPDLDPAEGHRACARYEMEKRIGLITTPTLLIGGDEDSHAMLSIDPLREHLTAARSVEVTLLAGGRVPLMEQFPREVAYLVRQFVQKVVAQPE